MLADSATSAQDISMIAEVVTLNRKRVRSKCGEAVIAAALLRHATENERSVGTAKSERIREHNVD
jgi:hypothetical protein